MSIMAVVFDLDGTLAESKSPVDQDMCDLLAALSEHVPIAVISGASWAQMEEQVLPQLGHAGVTLSRVTLLPVSGAQLWEHMDTDVWRLVTEAPLEDREHVLSVAQDAVRIFSSGLLQWGNIIEDRGSQVTLSMLGQEAPLSEKKSYDPHGETRQRIRAWIQERLPRHSVLIGGSTSIDIKTHGEDKAAGMRRLSAHLQVPADSLLFIGDDLDEGGNDHPVRGTGCLWLRVTSPEDTCQVITLLLRMMA
jgi:phosphomannomutase